MAIEYLSIGHITLDEVQGREQALGGGALFAAITARRMGNATGLYTSCGNEFELSDVLGDIQVTTIAARHSTTLSIYYDAATRRQIIHNVAEPLPLAGLPNAWRSPRILHLAPECDEVDLSMLEGFPNSFICLTPQAWLRGRGENGVLAPRDWPAASAALEKADAIVLSQEDLKDPGLVKDWAGQTSCLIVTLAEKGCLVYSRGTQEPYHVRAFKPAREVDPTGAGDVFAAAFFCKLVETNNPILSADWASCVASFVVEEEGPKGIPSLRDVDLRYSGGSRC